MDHSYFKYDFMYFLLNLAIFNVAISFTPDQNSFLAFSSVYKANRHCVLRTENEKHHIDHFQQLV